MPRSLSAPIPDPAISDSLRLLAELVGQAVEAIGEAQALQADERQNEAVQAITGIGMRLEEAMVLHKAIETLHRHR